MNRRSLLRIGTLSAVSYTALALPTQAAASAAAGPLAASRFDHLSLNVRAFDAMMAWYRDVLGFEIEVAWRVQALGGKRLAYLRLGDTRLELVEADADGIGLPEAADFLDHFARTGFGHLCFAVADADATMTALTAAGVQGFVRPETYDLDGTPYRRRVGFVKDPEGNVLEFAEPLFEAA
ncbi:MAG: VOC family protein [Pseudomonadota bacterium]